MKILGFPVRVNEHLPEGSFILADKEDATIGFTNWVHEINYDLDKIGKKYKDKLDSKFKIMKCDHENDEQVVYPGGGGTWRCLDCGDAHSF